MSDEEDDRVRFEHDNGPFRRGACVCFCCRRSRLRNPDRSPHEDAIRSAALEEAAKECVKLAEEYQNNVAEGRQDIVAAECARRIRALKEKKT